RQSLDVQVGQTIGQINTLATQIADRNTKIAAAEVSGQHANDLRDQRDQLVNDLAKLVDVSTIEDSTGQLTVFVGRGQPLVAQGSVYNLVGVASSSNNGLLDVQFGTGGSSTISISSLISNGTLKGLLDARDTTIPGLQNSLDTLAASLAHEVNQLNKTGYGLDGSTGVNLFTPLSVSTSAPSTNTGAATVSASAITANSLLTMHDYEVRFSAANAYSIVDTTTGATIKGNYTGTAITAPTVDAPINIVTGTNDTLTVSVDGTVSGVITLTGAASPGQAYSSGAALATEMQTKINADATLAAAGKSVTVTFDTTTNRFVITSNNTTGSSAVNVTAGTARATLGLAAGTSTAASGVYGSPQTFNFDGISVTVTGVPAANDKLSINTRTGFAKNVGVAITDGNKIAASSTLAGVPGDNSNAVAMAALQTKAIAGLGNVPFTSYYSTAVTNLGAAAQKADRDVNAQDLMQQQLEGFRAQVSGVSLDEEMINMLQYQRAYEAASRLIVMSDQLLQELLNLKQQ
ncbi:MAG TPA: flagellar basal body rod C-terminal domain-containing protein, partial [Nitrospirales bacterium]|nr:flagellar basal body rod C-terminal domain-containing protein [Nitrospirales bacterium]